jgi:hypothetical protein
MSYGGRSTTVVYGGNEIRETNRRSFDFAQDDSLVEYFHEYVR